MRRILTILFAVSILMSLPIWISAARDEELKPVPDSMKIGFDSITKEDAFNYVDFLACDELEGRDTGLRGMRIARRYIASLYSLWGLKPAGDMEGESRSFHQLIDMMEILPGGEKYLEVHKGGSTFIHRDGEDVFMGRGSAGSVEIEAPVVFAGYGISAPDLGYDDFAGLDVKGKIVLVVSGVPGAENPDSPFAKPENSHRFSGYMHMRSMGETLSNLGAVAVLTVGEQFSRPGQTKAWSDDYKQGSRINSPRRSVTIPQLTDFGGSLTSMRIDDKVAEELLAGTGTSLTDLREKIDSALKPASLAIQGVTVKIHTETMMKSIVSGNVIGMIEGSDPELKKEAVLIGAHLDHEGITPDGYVFNGADDNASGSAGVLEAAQAFALNPVKPKRSIIFACWTGEEKGLLGSRYFAQFPTMPDVKIVACLNMDMISRDWAPERLKEMSRRMGAFAEGVEINDQTIKRLVTASMSAQSPALAEISSRLNKDYIGTLYVTRPSNDMAGGSDHAPFHMRKIPAMFFFAAMTDDYHQPGDTADKMNTEKMRDIIRLLYLTAFEIADSDETITWTEPEK